MTNLSDWQLREGWAELHRDLVLVPTIENLQEVLARYLRYELEQPARRRHWRAQAAILRRRLRELWRRQ